MTAIYSETSATPVRVFLYVGQLHDWTSTEKRSVYFSWEDPLDVLLDTLRDFYLCTNHLHGYPHGIPTVDNLRSTLPANSIAGKRFASMIDLLRYHCAPSAVQLDVPHLSDRQRLVSLFSSNVQQFNDDAHLRLLCDYEESAIFRHLEYAARRRELRFSYKHDNNSQPPDPLRQFLTEFPLRSRYQHDRIRVYADSLVNQSTVFTLRRVRSYIRLDL